MVLPHSLGPVTFGKSCLISQFLRHLLILFLFIIFFFIFLFFFFFFFFCGEELNVRDSEVFRHYFTT